MCLVSLCDRQTMPTCLETLWNAVRLGVGVLGTVQKQELLRLMDLDRRHDLTIFTITLINSY